MPQSKVLWDGLLSVYRAISERQVFPAALWNVAGDTSAGFFFAFCVTLLHVLLLNSSQFCIFVALETQV